jgi:hypothetical protein
MRDRGQRAQIEWFRQMRVDVVDHAVDACDVGRAFGHRWGKPSQAVRNPDQAGRG